MEGKKIINSVIDIIPNLKYVSANKLAPYISQSMKSDFRINDYTNHEFQF